MSRRFRLLREISRARTLRQIISGHTCGLIKPDVKLFATNLNLLQHAWTNSDTSVERGHFSVQRFSSVSETSAEPCHNVDLLSFIQTTIHELEGPYHCWLNRLEDGKAFSTRDNNFLIIAGAPLDESPILRSELLNMFEMAKALQQRYPALIVMGFQSGSSVSTNAVRTHLLEIIMNEFITFPVLLSNKDFLEVIDRPCYIICEGFKNPILHQSDADIGMIDKAIKELIMQQSDKPSTVQKLKSTWVKQIEVVKEPCISSALRNFLLHFPGCISVDETGNRVFLSDTNHHRILIFEGNGKIKDCIGSCLGFGDGEFESAMLARPAASFYDAAEDCLYFVDSENHAIRKADLENRVLETIYPTTNSSKQNFGLWSWIMDKLSIQRDVDTKPAVFSSESLLFPWHLMKSSDGDLFILNRSFGTLWIMDFTSGVVKHVVKGYPKISEICGQMIKEKLSLLKHISSDWLQQKIDYRSSDVIPYAGLVSSIASLRDHIVICDTVGQTVMKVSKETGLSSSFQFSNFGILGLPYWTSFSLERVYTMCNVWSGVHTDHTQSFSLLPGRTDIKLNITIPEDTELVDPLNEGCIWRQARGAASEVSEAESRVSPAEKVGVSQQWYDELDNLAFLSPEQDLGEEDTSGMTDKTIQEGKICIDCAVNTSPGTCEVIIYAALYLKMKSNSDLFGANRAKIAGRIADILNPKRRESMRNDRTMELLSNASINLDEIIFMKPLHVRVKINCRDHPKANNSREIILTDSSIDVDVSLV